MISVVRCDKHDRRSGSLKHERDFVALRIRGHDWRDWAIDRLLIGGLELVAWPLTGQLAWQLQFVAH